MSCSSLVCWYPNFPQSVTVPYRRGAFLAEGFMRPVRSPVDFRPGHRLAGLVTAAEKDQGRCLSEIAQLASV